ncbi:Alkaline phosphatase D precursor [Rubripirellula tenax]|uniref:Alkaline phosphatase D n=1 Tax=Rubripirellula tenax TaxID=2528015 RepID=A0A5C6FAG6_9BACT|nr:alkaline phosphatase D family protein [Rubripirellula tenax]TWU58763.1 Alkaline phosphatase D precursor [Rubripirellula tenax]
MANQFPLQASADLFRDAGFDRRQFIRAASALSLIPLVQRPALGVAVSNVSFKDYPFSLGVASGDPLADGVVLWTRLAPDPLHGGGMPNENIEVRWEVCSDEAMKKKVAHGMEVASPEFAHSVHVEVSGLKPGHSYWYRFKAGDEVSPIGRTRTAPAIDSMPDRLRFAFASCQHFESGFFNAYYHMANEDLDLIVHLGDYIYEGDAAHGSVRKHVGLEIDSLDDYRNRHAQYKTDTDLQASHAAFPWLVTWDDHEFDNNYAGDISEQTYVEPAAFLIRRANAYQAFYEHMPLRKSAIPRGPLMQIYRGCSWGRLADFDVLDTRQYRSDQPCGDGKSEPCPESLSDKQTMLGPEQQTWLDDRLRQSPAIWNVLAQQVMMGRADRKAGDGIAYSMDQWPGYEVPRRRLMQFLHDQQIRNPVVLTGDIHTNWVNDLKIDFDDDASPTVASEFVCTSISSGGNGGDNRRASDIILAENPFVRFHNAQRGYVRCDVTPKQWQSDYQVVPYVTRKGSPQVTRASFVVEEGKAGAERV